jgi:hypothetical protein
LGYRLRDQRLLRGRTCGEEQNEDRKPFHGAQV